MPKFYEVLQRSGRGYLTDNDRSTTTQQHFRINMILHRESMGKRKNILIWAKKVAVRGIHEINAYPEETVGKKLLGVGFFIEPTDSNFVLRLPAN